MTSSGIPKQPKDDDARLRKGDIGLAKMFITGKPITLNELHGILLGVALGIIVAVLLFFGSVIVATAGALIIPGLSLTRIKAYGIGGRTMSHEPWWFVLPYAISLLLCILILVLLPI